MRIAIDALALKNDFSGIDIYIYNFIKEIQKIDNINTYFIFISDKLRLEKELSAKDNFIFKVVSHTSNPLWRIFYEQIILPWRLLRLKVDIFHSPIFILPLVCPIKSIITVHDISFKIYPEFISWPKRLYYNFFVRHSLNKAGKIIAISKNTKVDLIRLFGIPEKKIEAVYYGRDISYRPLDRNLAKDKVSETFGINDEFILYVGRIEPRKNLSRLIEAFHRIKREDNIKHKLVIAGHYDWQYKNIFNLAQQLGLKDKIIFLGYVKSNELIYLYNASDLFIYPSLYEGFGLPVLEAMACGVAVITSNDSSLREITSGGAFLVNPYNIQELREAIRRLLRDTFLRNNLAQRGLERIKEFSWQSNALKTKDLYEETYPKEEEV